MLIGLIFLLISSFIFNSLDLVAMSWLLNQFQTVWVVAFVILFQLKLEIINLCWTDQVFPDNF